MSAVRPKADIPVIPPNIRYVCPEADEGRRSGSLVDRSVITPMV
jgi:hypothetical protein